MSNIANTLEEITGSVKFPHDYLVADWEIREYLDALDEAIEDIEDIMEDLEGEEWELANQTKKELEAEKNGYEWLDGKELISESHFRQYVMEKARESYPNLDVWPATHIDWDTAIEDIEPYYDTVEIDDTTYYYES